MLRVNVFGSEADSKVNTIWDKHWVVGTPRTTPWQLALYFWTRIAECWLVSPKFPRFKRTSTTATPVRCERKTTVNCQVLSQSLDAHYLNRGQTVSSNNNLRHSQDPQFSYPPHRVVGGCLCCLGGVLLALAKQISTRWLPLSTIRKPLVIVLMKYVKSDNGLPGRNVRFVGFMATFLLSKFIPTELLMV